MKKTFNINGIGFSVTIENALNPDVITDQNRLWRFRYDVSIVCGGAQYQTKFTDSHNNYKQGIVADIDDVFKCIVNDAIAYIQQTDIDEFQGAFFGNEAKASQVIKAFEACKAIADFFEQCGISEDDICDYLNNQDNED